MDGKSDTNLWRVSREATSASIDSLMGAENTTKLYTMKKMATIYMKTLVPGTVLDIQVTLSRGNMPLSLGHCKRLICWPLKLKLKNSSAKGSRKRCVQWLLPFLPTMKCMRRLQKCKESLLLGDNCGVRLLTLWEPSASLPVSTYPQYQQNHPMQ